MNALRAELTEIGPETAPESIECSAPPTGAFSASRTPPEPLRAIPENAAETGNCVRHRTMPATVTYGRCWRCLGDMAARWQTEQR